MPPAPGLFSMITALPSLACIDSARMRPTMSAPPPGPNDTTIRMFCCGQSCASAGRAAVATSTAAANIRQSFFITILPLDAVLWSSAFAAAAAYFVDNDAVVQFGFAGPHTCFQHVGMHFEHRQ